MTWLALGAVALVLVAYLYALFTQGEIRRLVRTLRWIVGGGLAAIAAVTGLRGNMMLASFFGIAAAGVLTRGRLGPIDFGSGMSSPNNASTVKSRYLAMRLEHETGQVSGTVREGLFNGRELASLSAEECWALYDELGDDPDSVALFESWLDANRSGWREWFAENFGMDAEAPNGNGQRTYSGNSLSGVEEAYEILGLKPGARAEDIRKAHRALMKKVHPDHGGSSFLAARINEAKDLLLSHVSPKAK